jgi:hypothetical protein
MFRRFILNYETICIDIEQTYSTRFQTSMEFKRTNCVFHLTTKKKSINQQLENKQKSSRIIQHKSKIKRKFFFEVDFSLLPLFPLLVSSLEQFEISKTEKNSLSTMKKNPNYKQEIIDFSFCLIPFFEEFGWKTEKNRLNVQEKKTSKNTCLHFLVYWHTKLLRA